MIKNKTAGRLLFLSFIIVFLTFFINYITPKVWDYDFWWHLATGRYIVENSSIPDFDPFSYVNNLEENQAVKNPVGIQFNLRQYWLAQAIFYLVYKWFGSAGIMVLRGSLLFLSVFTIFWALKRWRVGYFIIFPLIFCVHGTNLSYIGERPVLFTVLLSVVTFYLLMDYKRNNNRLFFALVPLMLLWANLHGGFLLGIILIGTFMLGETANYFLKRDPLEKQRLLTLYCVGLAAIAASGVNPNGFNGFLVLAPKYQSLFQAGVQEYQSPFVLYRNKVSGVNWWYIAMLSILPLVVMLRNRRMDISNFILLAGLCYMSISSLRYVIFYVSLGAMILGMELDAVTREFSEKFESSRLKIEQALALLILISSVLFASGYLKPGSIVFGEATRSSVAGGAADFVEQNKIKGNMFNDMGHGGYLIWRLYPEKRIFIDTRALNYTVMKEYSWIMQATESIKNEELPKGSTPLWQRLLDHYNVNFLVLRSHDVYGNIPELMFSLLKSDEWVPVFYDAVGQVFVRDSDDNAEIIAKYRIDEESMYNMLVATFTMMAMDDSKNPFYMVSLGDIFYDMQNYKDALQAYEYADKRIPNRPDFAAKIAVAKERLAVEEQAEKKDR
ncbi:MAG: tetratricopeptide repeat protein [Thermodesulfovibrionales bacterium]